VESRAAMRKMKNAQFEYKCKDGKRPVKERSSATAGSARAKIIKQISSNPTKEKGNGVIILAKDGFNLIPIL
jgi:hypothetical protein